MTQIMRRLFWLYLLVTASQTTAQDCGTSVRRPWRSLSCEEQQNFLRACQDLKSSGRWDELVINHFESAEWSHAVPAFLFWHRWLLWITERELQRISGTCLTIPYWDWERSDRGVASIFQPDTFGRVSGRGCVRDGSFRDWRVVQNGGCLRREFDDRWRISRDVEVLSRITNFPDFGRFRVEFEGTPHINVHEWVGGAMEERWAVDDPLFFLHHSNVDRIFALWQNYWGYNNVDLAGLGRQHYDGRLSEELVFRYVRRLDWFSPGTGRPPTIRELMKINGDDAIVSVSYEDDNLAQQLVQTSSRFATSIDTTWNAPGRVSSTPRCTPGDGNDDAGFRFGPNNQRPQCRPRQAPCNQNGQCCSRRCRNGFCRRRNNMRALRDEESEKNVDKDPEYLHEAPDFGDQQDRWYQLMEEFTPLFPSLIFERLAAEDCQAQEKEQGQPLKMVSAEWLAMHHTPENATHAYECHSVPTAWNPIVEGEHQENDGPEN